LGALRAGNLAIKFALEIAAVAVREFVTAVNAVRSARAPSGSSLLGEHEENNVGAVLAGGADGGVA
jgi:galactokinase